MTFLKASAFSRSASTENCAVYLETAGTNDVLKNLEWMGAAVENIKMESSLKKDSGT